MISKLVLMALAVVMLMTPAGLAQDAEKPTIAILLYGPTPGSLLIRDNLLTALAGQGIISPADLPALFQGQSIEAEGANVHIGDAQFDFATAQTLVRGELDKGVDVLVTLTTPITQAAVNATADMDDPPAVLFAEVAAPYLAGLGELSCIKPAHVTGVSIETPYDEILPLLLLQDPDIKTIGVIYSSSEVSGVEGAEKVRLAAGELGIAVIDASVVAVSDIALATDGLVEKGAEALVVPTDLITAAGMPVIMQIAVENGIPVFHTAVTNLRVPTVSAGTTMKDFQASILGAILGSFLAGELDLATIGFGSVSNLYVGVNLDVAEAQNIEISPSLVERANLVFQDGRVTDKNVEAALEQTDWDEETKERVRTELATVRPGTASFADMSPETMKLAAMAMQNQPDPAAALQSYFASVACTPEIIAEQQAALDADA